MWHIVGTSNTGPCPSALACLFWGVVLLVEALGLPLSHLAVAGLVCVFLTAVLLLPTPVGLSGSVSCPLPHQRPFSFLLASCLASLGPS